MKTPLTREQLKSVITGNGAASRVPMLYDLWVHPWTFGEDEAAVRAIMADYPMDACIVPIRMPNLFTAPEDDPEYRFMNFDNPNKDETGGIDERVALSDFKMLDDVLKDFPNPNYPNMYPEHPPEDGRYRVACWFYCLFERHWSIRGMTNALMDFYLYPEQVHKLYGALTDFYIRLMERAKEENNADGIFTSDDLGTQTGPFFSKDIFCEFFKPYYKRMIQRAHELGMEFWLHTCGNIELFMDDFIEIGLDVIHPIQKHTMDEKEIVRRYGGKICFWAGFDVQQIIPWGTPDEVRKEVRFLIDTYSRPDGRFMLTAGNGVNQDCPVESLKALYDETYTYGINAGGKK